MVVTIFKAIYLLEWLLYIWWCNSCIEWFRCIPVLLHIPRLRCHHSDCEASNTRASLELEDTKPMVGSLLRINGSKRMISGYRYFEQHPPQDWLVRRGRPLAWRFRRWLSTTIHHHQPWLTIGVCDEYVPLWPRVTIHGHSSWVSRICNQCETTNHPPWITGQYWLCMSSWTISNH